MTDAELTQLLESYQPSEKAIRIVQNAKVVLLVGITGAGKNTLKQALLKDDNFYDFISHTTRPPRSNLGVMEENGKDYFFIDVNEAIRMLTDGEYIEAKKVHSNIYGTTVEGLAPSVESAKIAVNDVDVQGVDEYKSISPAVHAIFVLPPSFEAWNSRRLARYQHGIDEDDNAVRLASAKKEIEFALSKGYFEFLVNDDVSMAAKEVLAIVNGTTNTSRRNNAEKVARQLLAEISTH